MPTPTNNQPGASLGPWEVYLSHHQYFGPEVVEKDTGLIVTTVAKRAGPEALALIASAPDLLKENLALKAAVAEFQEYLADDHEIAELILEDFNALFNPLTGAKGVDDDLS